MTENEAVPIWIFAVFAISLNSIGYILNIITLEAAIIFTALLGMPTWFVGILWLGIKSDELLGVEDAFVYEAPSNNSQNKN